MPAYLPHQLRSLIRIIACSSILMLPFCGVVNAQAASNCGPFENNYGPFDYRTATAGQLSIVENKHFNQRIENLLPGSTNPWADDISYTLRVFPNHHRALVTIQRLAEREKTDKPAYAQYSIACYFDRAIRYKPDDLIVRMLFAEYLIKRSRNDEALQQLEFTAKMARDNPFTHYNVGLLFLNMKSYDRALTEAHRAMELGFTRTELKDGLVATGKWVEPPNPEESTKP
jgi:tetratricopeptide (TPR) repeat protein